MSEVFVNEIGVVAPGLPDWAASQAVLCGQLPWFDAPMPKLVPDILPANERRRTTELIKLALSAAWQVLAKQRDTDVASVFASSDGDLFIVDRLCEALLLDDKPVSPTLFHNSVHNASAGYLAIASGARSPYSSISAGDASFAAGLLECVAQMEAEARDLLLVAYDYPGPEPISSKRHFAMPFAISLLLGREPQQADAVRLRLDLCFGGAGLEVTKCQASELELLRAGNPIARSLPLLEAIARRQNCAICLPGVADTQLVIEVMAT